MMNVLFVSRLTMRSTTISNLCRGISSSSSALSCSSSLSTAMSSTAASIGQYPAFYRHTMSFYKYFRCKDLDVFSTQLKTLFSRHGALGRIYIAPEGINAQFSLPCYSIESFNKELYDGNAVPDLKGVFVNADGDVQGPSDVQAFNSLHIRRKTSLINDGKIDKKDAILIPETDGNEDLLLDKVINGDGHGSRHLSPAQWHKKLLEMETSYLDDKANNVNAKKDKPICIDTRNWAESEVGAFAGSELSNVDHFRDCFATLERMLAGRSKDSEVLIYCTGGIRCEKVAAHLVMQGFSNVCQLQGGINHYVQYVRKNGLESLFRGTNFVWDHRSGIKVTEQPFGQCSQCNNPCDHHQNCSKRSCHVLFVQCSSCAKVYNHCCSVTCAIGSLTDEEEARSRARESAIRRRKQTLIKAEARYHARQEYYSKINQWKRRVNLCAPIDEKKSTERSSHGFWSSSALSPHLTTEVPLPAPEPRDPIVATSTSLAVRAHGNEFYIKGWRRRLFSIPNHRPRRDRVPFLSTLPNTNNNPATRNCPIGIRSFSSTCSNGDISIPPRQTRDVGLGELQHMYAGAMSTPLQQSSLLDELAAETRSLFPHKAHMMVGASQGRLLVSLAESVRATRILDLGCFTGYSALCLTETLRVNHVTTVEVDNAVASVARRYFKLSPHAHKVHLQLKPAMTMLDSLTSSGEAPYDFIFMDCDKGGYKSYYDRIIDGGILSPRGMLVVDNVLFRGLVADPSFSTDEVSDEKRMRSTQKTVLSLREFNAYVAADMRTTQSLIPAYDGLLVIQQTI